MKSPVAWPGFTPKPHFFLYTFTPILISSLFGTETFPSVEAIVIDFPVFDCTGALPPLPDAQNG